MPFPITTTQWRPIFNVSSAPESYQSPYTQLSEIETCFTEHQNNSITITESDAVESDAIKNDIIENTVGDDAVHVLSSTEKSDLMLDADGTFLVFRKSQLTLFQSLSILFTTFKARNPPKINHT